MTETAVKPENMFEPRHLFKTPKKARVPPLNTSQISPATPSLNATARNAEASKTSRNLPSPGVTSPKAGGRRRKTNKRKSKKRSTRRRH